MDGSASTLHPDHAGFVLDLAAHAARVDREGAFPWESLDALHEAGLLALTARPEDGGKGAGLAQAAAVVRTLAGSSRLPRGELGEFHAFAVRIAPPGTLLVLFDALGRQVVNSSEPFGSPALAEVTSGALPHLRRTLDREGVVISDLYFGARSGRPSVMLAQRVEDTIRGMGQAEVDAHEVGLAILAPLRELDEVAYLRFASVYQAFDSLDDFESAIGQLRTEHAAAASESDPDPER